MMFVEEHRECNPQKTHQVLVSISFSCVLIYDSGLNFGPFGKRSRIHPYLTVNNLYFIRCYLFLKRRRRASIVRKVLIAVPGTRYTAVYYFPFTQWSVLMFA